MGNQITRDYDIQQQPCLGRGGPGNCWQVFSAKKKSTGQPVTVFLFDKKQFFEAEDGGAAVSLQQRAQMSMQASWTKREQEEFCQLLKREAEQLARLRHPCLLEMVEPVSESRQSIAFATEPLATTLSALLADKMRSGGSTATQQNHAVDLLQLELDHFEAQKGLTQLGRALLFLHQDARVIHGNIMPGSVYINTKGDWKLGGFGHCIHFGTPGGAGMMGMNGMTADGFQTIDYGHQYNLQSVEYLRPTMDYLAPECLLDRQVSPRSDLFSLGCLMYHILTGRLLIECQDSLQHYKGLVERLVWNRFEDCPQEVRDLLRALVNPDLKQRPTLAQYQANPFFDNILMATIQFMERFPEKSPTEKIQFMKGLLKLLPQYPVRILASKILVMLLEELKEESLVTFLMPNIFFIAEKLSPRDFERLVLPKLKQLFTAKDSESSSMAILEKLDFILEKCSKPVIKQEIAPLLLEMMDSKYPLVVQRVLKSIPPFTEFLERSQIREVLIPRIQTLYSTSGNLSIRVNTLACIMALLKFTDKATISTIFLPLLRQNRLRHAAIYLATVGIYDELVSVLDIGVVSTDILPDLWSMAMDTVFNVDQFKKTMKIIRQAADYLEQQQLKILTERQLQEREKPLTVKDTPSTVSVNSDNFELLVKGGKKDMPPPLPTRAPAFQEPSKSTVSFTTNESISVPTLVPPPVQSFVSTSSGVTNDFSQWTSTATKQSNPFSNISSTPMQPLQPSPASFGQPLTFNSAANNSTTNAGVNHNPWGPPVNTQPPKSQSNGNPFKEFDPYS